MLAHLRRNSRLAWAFRVCKDLGIDDPAYWLNNTDPAVLDGWIAYYRFDSEIESGSGSGSPDEAIEKLRNL